jgi:hypothetical protein
MHQMRISTTQVSSMMLRSKKLEIREKMWNWKSRWIKTKQSAMKLSQIRRRLELWLREIILRFEMNLCWSLVLFLKHFVFAVWCRLFYISILYLISRYRLSPEFPFPVPLEDCVTATSHFLRHSQNYRADRKRIGVMGTHILFRTFSIHVLWLELTTSISGFLTERSWVRALLRQWPRKT